MNKKTLIAGLIGFIIGAAIIPDYGWLLGSVLGGLLGQLLHLSERLQQVENQLHILKSAGAREPESPREPEPVAPPVRPAAAVPPQPVPAPAAAARTADHAAMREPDAGNTFRSGILGKALERVRRFFLEGNPIVRVGMVVMLFGLGFLAKYAASAGMFPIHLRLAIIALIAIALLIIGWRTREKKNGYGLVLQGGGVAALYLTVFAAAKLYLIFSTGFAFALMLLIVFLGVMLAVLQNAQILALMAAAGGFLAPILTSDGSGNHVLLFAFYLLLNLGILAIALFKTWRWLNWVGFVFTFAISSAWGALSYEPHLYHSTQPFLIAFFLLYLCVSVLFSIKQPLERRGLVDGSLIFGLPIVGFGLQAALLVDSEYGLSISAVILAAIYLVLASTLNKRFGAAQRLLVESFIALGLGFATIAIPLALDAEWTSAVWALEAAGLIWVGLRQARLLPRLAAYGLYLAAVVSIFIQEPFETGATPVVSGDFLGFAILSFAALAIAYLLFKYRSVAHRFEPGMQGLAIGTGLLWWLLAGLIELSAHVDERYLFALYVIFVSASLGALNAVADRLQWMTLSKAGYSLLPLIILISLPFMVMSLFDVLDLHPAGNFGLPALLLLALVQYRFLARHAEEGNQSLLRAWHVITAWLWLALLFWEAAYWQREFGWSGTSSVLLWFACFAGPLVVLMAVVDREHWPFTQHRLTYKKLVPIPGLLLLMFWFIETCAFSGATHYLHLPVFNPLDLAQLGAIMIFIHATKNRLASLERMERPLRYGSLAVLGFIWINVVVMRSVHYYGYVPYEAYALWNSATLQMALSIVWTLCALAIMLASQRLQSRPLWLLGAGLLGLVVIKLFTKDLTGSGTLPRVISFMAVGALMLIIGYLSPIPANRSMARAEEAVS